MTVAHVFPFDPRHLSADPDAFLALQRHRWPLAAVAESNHAAESSAHFIGRRSRRVTIDGLRFLVHRSFTSGPRFRGWGDDWSWSLGRTLRRLGHDDICVLHLNDYAAARYAHRAAARARVVLVFHGRGLGRADDHLLAADAYVVLTDEAAAQLAGLGVRRDAITVLTPSVDHTLFTPGDDEPERVAGFIGRLEASKGVAELPRVLEAAPGARIEAIGHGTSDDRDALLADAEARGVAARLSLLGELPPADVAQRMRTWRALLLPSYSEGSPLVAAEAAVARIPVVAVAGVLPAAVEQRAGVHVAARSDFAELAARVLATPDRPPPADIPTHAEAGAGWDALIDGLAPWAPRRRPRVSRRRRVRASLPVRRGGRLALGAAATLVVSRRRRRPVLVTPLGRWWVHRYRSGALPYPRFRGPSPEEFDAETRDTFLHRYVPRAGDVVVDVGAGIGEEALTFSRLVGPTGRVICIEAHPDTFARLQATIRLNRLHNVEAVQLAVADRAGDVTISDYAEHHGNTLADEGVAVPSDTLDAVYRRLGLDRVDFLKMNIEGAERHAVRAWDDALARTRNLAISCHDFLLEHGAPADVATFELVRAAVVDAGFDVSTRPDDPKPWNRYYVYGTRPDASSSTPA